MNFAKFAAGTITTIIALWIGMWVLKFLLALLGVVSVVVFLVLKLLFWAIVCAAVLGVIYFIWALLFKPKTGNQP